jgi:hypothetical protein
METRCVKFVILVFFCALVASFPLFSGTSSTDDFKYERYSNRMEGLRRIPTTGGSIVLQSFVLYREEMSLSKDLILKVHFYLPRTGSAFLSAVELRRHGLSHYQMRPINSKWSTGWNEFSPWPAKDVLFPLKISPNDISVVVRMESDEVGSGTVAPAILYSDPDKLPLTVGNYSVVFFPTVSLSYLDFSVINVDSGQTVSSGQKRNIGAKVPFSIEFDISDRQEGLYRLLILAEEYGRTIGPERQYFFYHFPGLHK